MKAIRNTIINLEELANRNDVEILGFNAIVKPRSGELTSVFTKYGGGHYVIEGFRVVNGYKTNVLKGASVMVRYECGTITNFPIIKFKGPRIASVEINIMNMLEIGHIKKLSPKTDEDMLRSKGMYGYPVESKTWADRAFAEREATELV